ncbi:MAG: hypothetical protein M5U09_30230 [Gammaproteobacteria bacterium]|nr:hypothetical protein [Gammaproteobacteria bacterium]
MNQQYRRIRQRVVQLRIAHQCELNRGATEAFDAVRRRRHHHDAVRVGRPDQSYVHSEGFSIKPAERMPADVDREPRTAAFIEKPRAGTPVVAAEQAGAELRV